jgi:hypothetical protein
VGDRQDTAAGRQPIRALQGPEAADPRDKRTRRWINRPLDDRDLGEAIAVADMAVDWVHFSVTWCCGVLLRNTRTRYGDVSYPHGIEQRSDDLASTMKRRQSMLIASFGNWQIDSLACCLAANRFTAPNKFPTVASSL